MYWAEVTLSNNKTQKVETHTLNEMFELFGQYTKTQRKKYKATQIVFGHNNTQTGVWTPSTGLRSI